MPRAKANGIEIEYETFGDPDGPPLLLVSGLGAQKISWAVDFCEALVDRGFSVTRFDNRDVGLSSKTDLPEPIDFQSTLARAFQGEPVAAPYTLHDMAADAVGLLDALGIQQAHVAGASMGGMIVQTMAIDHPGRLLSLTSIMSTTGDRDVGQANPDVLPLLLQRRVHTKEEYLEQAVEASRLIGSPEHFEEERVRERESLAWDRGYYPVGLGVQLLAILASGSRSAALRKLDVNALVIHGDADPLVNMSGGERTAECLQGSELVILEGMGHDLPTYYWARIIEGITNLAARSAASV
ncbi:MAG: alpha/beta hydrolase [Actinobacteria bacterium]|nr:alpha/beta hydrolase [Actinomycetota bacterium]